jgi:tetratricopeptide (TPR) repeat protein
MFSSSFSYVLLVTEESKQIGMAMKQEGNTWFAKKEWNLGIESYTKAIEEDPTDVTFYSNRSACYMHLHDYDAALQDAVICRYLKPHCSGAAAQDFECRCEHYKYNASASTMYQ